MRREDDEEVWYPNGMVVAAAVTPVGMPRARRDSRASREACRSGCRSADDDAADAGPEVVDESLFRFRRLLLTVHWAVRGLFLLLWLLHLSLPPSAVRE